MNRAKSRVYASYRPGRPEADRGIRLNDMNELEVHELLDELMFRKMGHRLILSD